MKILKNENDYDIFESVDYLTPLSTGYDDNTRNEELRFVISYIRLSSRRSIDVCKMKLLTPPVSNF